MTEYADVPDDVIAHLREICLALPEAYQEQAWAGTRWRIRKRTFAHVVTLELASRPAYWKPYLGGEGLVTALTFRAPEPEVAAFGNLGHPYFRAGWGRDVVGMVLEDDVDWNEVAELLTESYCVLAPKKLVDLVDRPAD